MPARRRAEAFSKSTRPGRNAAGRTRSASRENVSLNDEVYLPGDLLLRNESVGETGMDSTQYVTVRRSKKLGEYLVTLRYNYHRVPIVVAEP
jgi:hypothetical protein